jgi:PIN domain nuclease of toxin-antitoxin system
LNLLLDTCCLLWWATEPQRLSGLVREALNEQRNALYLSVASVWEIAIKAKTGRLSLSLSPEDFIADAMKRYDLQQLDINLAHSLGAGSLGLHHKDPFDRMLIAQAKIEGLTIATPDPAFTPYGVPLLW